MYDFTKEQVVAACENAEGIIDYVARELGCSWRAANDHIRKHPEAIEALEKGKAKLNSLAYKGFIKAVEREDRWAVERILETSARHNGHGLVQYQEVDHTSGGDKITGISVVFNAPKGTTEDAETNKPA